MLASITPLGERGRHNRFSLTMVAFLTGSAGAGAAAGALLGWLGGLAGPARGPIGGTAALAVLAAALGAAAASDLVRDPAPGPRRQVDERWLDSYRGWVYGLGYGAQLGLGLATVVSSAATYVALGAAWLSARPAAGAAILGAYGTLRGLTPLLAARVRTPAHLLALHRRLQRARGPVLGGSVALLAAAAAAAATVAGLG